MRWKPILASCVITAILAIAICLRLYFATFQGQITGFYQIGSDLPLSPYLADQEVLVVKGGGYDGQFFLTLALDPGLNHPDTPKSLDMPQYRSRRILYPLLGHLLGAGNSHWIPYALVALNAVAVVLLVGVGGLLLRQNGASPWRSLLLLLIPGVWNILLLSTSDLISTLLILFSIYSYASDRPRATALGLLLACFTRETSLFQWLAIALCSGLDRRWQQLRLLLLILLPLAAWNLYIYTAVPASALETNAARNFGLPFVGLAQAVLSLQKGGWSGANLIYWYSFVLLLCVAAAVLLPIPGAWKTNKLIWLSAASFGIPLILSSMAILEFPVGYQRVFLPLYCLVEVSGRKYPLAVRVVVLTLAGLVTARFLRVILLIP